MNLFSYSKLVAMKIIECLFDDNSINTVCVQYDVTNKDRMFDCQMPMDMINLERIMRECSLSVLGSELYHHHRIVDQEEIDGKETGGLQAGWRREC